MDTQGSPLKSGERLMSVDALRGFDMFLIIGGGRTIRDFIKAADINLLNKLLPQLDHVPWEGFSFWDIIMPLFLFIVGVAMPFSFIKRLALGDSKAKLYRHIIIRSVILFILGMAAQGHLLEYDLSKLHIYCNTLQAIAAGYLVASFILLNLRLIWQIIATAVLLLLFWALMALVPVPGYGRGILTPEGNLAIYIDRLILGRFEDGTSYTWILSSMTFACTVMLGVFAGYILRSQKNKAAKTVLLFALSFGLILLGILWHIFFPIIKHLWTSSFVLFSAGLSYFLLAAFYLVIDVLKFRRWSFGFVVIGTNAIFAYMSNALIDFRDIGHSFIGGLSRFIGQWDVFARSFGGFAIIWLVLYWMYSKKTFIKI
jgi:predicted acyltransferase